MAIFDYHTLPSATSKALFSDALAITFYTYHNLDNGFTEGYYRYGIGPGLINTLVSGLIGSHTSQGVIPGIPWNPDSEAAALRAVETAGWFPIAPQTLGYQGTVDKRGTYFGEQPGYTTAEAEVLGKYAADGRLIAIGIGFRGTSGPRESEILDSLGDLINDLKAGFGPASYSRDFTANAFGTLLKNVAAYASTQNLSGKDVLVTGHSLGGLEVNSMADLSSSHWAGFYQNASYLGFASPTQSQSGKVLNIGFENDPVFRDVPNPGSSQPSAGVHDTPWPSATNNIVSFNDYYASDMWNWLPFSIGNLATWLTHLPFNYSGMSRVVESSFYPLTEKDSTVIVANLSDTQRAKTWVQDLNRDAEPHSGRTFILGTEHDDLIKGAAANDYLEGGRGNDSFRDAGGYNLIRGGEGRDKLQLDQSLSQFQLANDGQGTLYLRDSKGDISLVQGIEQLVSTEPGFLWWTQQVTHEVTDAGMTSAKGMAPYSHSVNGDAGANLLLAQADKDWVFGNRGDDWLVSTKNTVNFVGGEGNDQMLSLSGQGGNTFLFSGAFGHDVITGYLATDRLVFIGVEATQQNSRVETCASLGVTHTKLTLGDQSVDLVGVAPSDIVNSSLVFA